MGLYKIIIPEDGVNYVTNPSFEEGTTDWGNYAGGTATGTRARVNTAYSGRWGYNNARTGGTGDFGTVWTAPAHIISQFASGDDMAVSVSVLSTDTTVTLELDINSGTETASTTVTTAGRTTITHTLGVTPTAILIRVYVASAAADGTFTFDAVQLEKNSYGTSYFDGAADGCHWVGLVHASSSERRGVKNRGGRAYDLQDDLNWTVVDHSDMGMPPLDLLLQQQTNLPGDLLRGFTVKGRTIQLNSNIDGSSLSNLLAVRKAIIDKIRPDRGQPPQPFTLRYTGGTVPLEIQVFYDAGLEFSAVTTTGFTDETAIRLYAPDPYWYEAGRQILSLDAFQSLTSVAGIIRYDRDRTTHNYTYQTMSNGFDSGTASVAIRGKDGRIYVGGSFTGVDSIASTRGIAIWDPDSESWSQWGGQLDTAGDTVVGMCSDAEGNIYIAGLFTGVNSVANTANLAKWDVGTSSWVSITPSGSASTLVNNCIVDLTGNLIVTGAFTTIDGSSITRLATYDGATWSGYGTGLNNDGYALAVDKQDALYVGGDFTTANGVTVNRIAKWNGTTFEALHTSGADSRIQKLLFADDGNLYLQGLFTTLGGISITDVGRWNGQLFEALGAGISGTSTNMEIDADGNIFVSGAITKNGDPSATVYNLLVFNGSVWTTYDFALTTGSPAWMLFVDSKHRYFGVPNTSTVNYYGAGSGSIVTTGTAKTYPVIYLENTTASETGHIRWIENAALDAILYLDYNLQPGESLTIDLTPGQRGVSSSLYGTVWGAIELNSDIEGFAVEPGQYDYDLRVFINGYTTSPTSGQFFSWQNKYWSVDSA